MSRGASLLVVVLFTGLLSGCSASTGHPERPRTTSTAGVPAGLTLTATISAEARPHSPAASVGPGQRGLLVHYAVRSRASGPVLVDDRIPVSDSATGRDDRVDPLRAFVYGGPGNAVTIAKRTFGQVPAPAGPDYSVRFQATVLRPGATVRGRAFVPLPLKEQLPGFVAPDPTIGRMPEKPAGWRFCVGITATVYPPDVLPGGRYALISNGITSGPRRPRLLCSGVRPVDVAPRD